MDEELNRLSSLLLLFYSGRIAFIILPFPLSFSFFLGLHSAEIRTVGIFSSLQSDRDVYLCFYFQPRPLQEAPDHALPDAEPGQGGEGQLPDGDLRRAHGAVEQEGRQSGETTILLIGQIPT